MQDQDAFDYLHHIKDPSLKIKKGNMTSTKDPKEEIAMLVREMKNAFLKDKKLKFEYLENYGQVRIFQL